MQTMLDATPRENPQWEVSRCGVANSWKRGPRLWESWPWAVESELAAVVEAATHGKTAVTFERLQFVWPCGNPIWRNRSNQDGPPARIVKSFDICLLETCGCNTMLAQGQFQFPKCQGWTIRAMRNSSISGLNHCCATRKRVIGDPVVDDDKSCWMPLCGASSRRRFRGSSRTRSQHP